MHNLLQFLNVFESIATFTIAMSAVGPFGLLVGDESFWVGAFVNIEVVLPSKLKANHRNLYVSLCWTSGENLSSRLVQGFPVTADIIRVM